MYEALSDPSILVKMDGTPILWPNNTQKCQVGETASCLVQRGSKSPSNANSAALDFRIGFDEMAEPDQFMKQPNANKSVTSKSRNLS